MCGVGRFFSGVCCCIGALVLAAAAFAQDDLEAPLVVQTASGKVCVNIPGLSTVHARVIFLLAAGKRQILQGGHEGRISSIIKKKKRKKKNYVLSIS